MNEALINDAVWLTLSFIAGGVLGAIFFGGLWWTIKYGLNSSRPALWFFTSLILRSAVVVGGFYLIGHNNWTHLGACLAGFILARLIIARRLRPVTIDDAASVQEHPHAS